MLPFCSREDRGKKAFQGPSKLLLRPTTSVIMSLGRTLNLPESACHLLWWPNESHFSGPDNVFLVSRRQSSLLAACHYESHSPWLKSHAEGQTPPLLLTMGPRAGYLTPRGLYFLVNMMGKPYQVIGLLNRIIGKKTQ